MSRAATMKVVSLDFIEEHGERIGALLTLRDAGVRFHRIDK